MDLLTAIKSWDKNLFLGLNNLPHPWFLDQVFLFFSFYPLIIWLIIGVIVVLYEERNEKLFLVRLVVALVLAGIVATALIKPIIRRPRPDISFGDQVVMVQEKPAAFPLSNDFAFPSGHAAVAFAGAYVVTYEEIKNNKKRKRKINIWIFYLAATLTAFSRIYLGKHYPLDVLAGGLLGWVMGWVAWKLVDLVKPPKAY
ncbi:MAG: Phosphoesterase PA-phosphatase related protein [Candidatus Gottesmanbacteria bacterium GW2011_GWB1_43_11]|uniref:Phosphoesterase PA-phosphatase related protein n=1 Tax=Candidatus Gottesmanbacteria bacterium GW2011_GWB1_43_11 TaxID=1618446 RepID=A0A0G1CNV7_9BACT|nr:MAG: Phosphoesterase PA-phosphatase related protein [Candidatus Gottesmanbacteria bacterium GW2011_GWA1_42_26]KKS80985.1 MAG: Phosphoesterase PA-phosphatase related protein [Candidatus Gottesmanbacteria bacterium GW2011_GWC1_43_10]KKS87234.1 MAG: Phosphoesterase PA-phosphatase related protein [Candidatus Gottesmanbacteria bacterium GW2011_GWB1_43_11]OGG10632.1 MAG: hypothetical protein A2699_03470 [Candidatus Gottesmanbacteria bacterium RIFCSPHIGHO2_01_FULL_43_15]OGG25239.1 MAG: hypothetical